MGLDIAITVAVLHGGVWIVWGMQCRYGRSCWVQLSHSSSHSCWVGLARTRNSGLGLRKSKLGLQGVTSVVRSPG